MNDEARRLLEEVCRGHNARGSDGPCDCNACRFLAQPTAAREAVHVKALEKARMWLLGRPKDTQPIIKIIDAALADTSPAAAALLAQGEALKEWAPILEAAQRQDIKWKKPMPEIDFGDEAIYVWALKAQEEMGELSAALLGGLIGKEGRGDVLEECYQLIAVLLRIARAALAPGEEDEGFDG